MAMSSYVSRTSVSKDFPLSTPSTSLRHCVSSAGGNASAKGMSDWGIARSKRKSGRERGENTRPAARAFMERGELVFLVRRMDAVVLEPEADHQRIHLEVALKDADDRDRAAGADQHRLFVPFRMQCATRAPERLRAEG